ncbi:MAG: TonB-dependent receptor [Ignavibacteria bacterium]|nr:TonB-dependent receptor [Ignavibacteria bacterium]
MTKNINQLISVFSLVFLFSLNLFTDPLNAQTIKGRISGVIVDKATSNPVESSDVRLLSATDSTFVTGTATDAAGNFLLEVIKPGRYILNVRMIGYSSFSVNEIILNKRNSEINLDTIRIRSGNEIQTDEIEVETQKSPIEFSADKKIFNVSDDITITGGNALDVLKNVPSIQVDVDGNVTLRGSQNVKILVDGKPFGLEGSNRNAILQQIPANSVESVELMTNPSAKYNPEGTTGILNIVLKKKTDTGYNGSISLNAGTDDKYSGSVNLNNKKNNVNFSGSYNYSNQKNIITGSSLRQNFFPGTAEFIDQLNSGNVKRLSHLIKAGVDFEIDRKQSIGFNLNYSPRNSNRQEKNENKYYDSLQNLNPYFLTNTSEDDAGKNFDASLNYNLKFKKSKEHTLRRSFIFKRNRRRDFIYRGSIYFSCK